MLAFTSACGRVEEGAAKQAPSAPPSTGAEELIAKRPEVRDRIRGLLVPKDPNPLQLFTTTSSICFTESAFTMVTK